MTAAPQYAVFAAFVFGVFGAAGCSNRLANFGDGPGAPASGSEAALLGDDATRSVCPAPASPTTLLSTTPGTRFISSRIAPQNEANTAGSTFPSETLETTVVGPQTVGGRQGVRYDTRLEGKPFQSEIYALSSGGAVEGLATGPNAGILLNPPLLLIGTGAAKQKGVWWTHWHGTLVPAGGNAAPIPAEALCRVSNGNDTVKTPMGIFQTLRVDITVALPGANGTTGTRRTTLWVAPGRGVIQQAYPDPSGQNKVWTLQKIITPQKTKGKEAQP